MEVKYSQSQTQKIADKSVYLMKKRILAGLNKNDVPFKEYSAKPFAMPSGATTKGTLAKVDKQFFKSKKTGNLWVVIKGGYLALKKARSPEGGDKVDLTVTGGMLRSLGVTKVSSGSFTIGFTRSEEAQKMYWQIAKGRDPIGLSPNDLKELTPLLQTGLEFYE